MYIAVKTCEPAIVMQTGAIISFNEWHTLAVMFDKTAMEAELWVDGNLKLSSTGSSCPGVNSQDEVHIGSRRYLTGFNDDRALTANLACMSLYNKHMTYQEMLQITEPFCTK